VERDQGGDQGIGGRIMLFDDVTCIKLVQGRVR
jgi:hypothetical protein